MAVTVANVTHPNQFITDFPFGPWKCRLVDITFDNSYLTTGEPLSAATLGVNQVHGAIVLYDAKNAAGTLAMPVVIVPNTARTSLTLQLLRYDGAAAGKASLEEAANAFDASLFTMRVAIIYT